MTFPHTTLTTVHRAALVAAMGVCLCLPARSVGLDSSTITTLTVEQARELMAKKKRPGEDLLGARVSLDRLKTLSPEVADVLITCSEFPLSLDGLEDLSAETATVLARQKPVAAFGCADLRLNGLKVITPAAAEALAAHRGMVLLHSLQTLDSVPLARKLAVQWGELRLGLRELSPEIAAELAKHGGFRADKTRAVKYRRADGAASVLRLDMITSLSPETAEALAAHEGVLVLNGLVSLDPPVAAALAKRVGNRENNRSGTLVLNGLPAISPEAATALAAFPGELLLRGITELSPEAAAALATHKGRLHLTGLTTLSHETRATLQGHTNVLLPRLPGGAP